MASRKSKSQKKSASQQLDSGNTREKPTDDGIPTWETFEHTEKKTPSAEADKRPSKDKSKGATPQEPTAMGKNHLGLYLASTKKNIAK